jgi:two-component system chemotaxis response regulator CheB
MKHRVLVIDDSPFVRRIIKDWLDGQPDFEVVATGNDGKEGAELAARLKPDLITLDVEMPRMNGIEALGAIMKEAPCPVIMVSSVTKQGAAYTIQALELGAVDFVTKPDGPSSIRLVHAKDELLEKCRIAVKARRPSFAPRTLRPSLQSDASVPHAAVRTPVQASTVSGSTDKVVVIASSTGGPKALTTLFSCLPKGFPAPIVIVQHMPAGFTDSFAKRLDQMGRIAVKEAAEGDRVMPGLALIAPGGRHLEVGPGGVIRLSDRPQLHGVRPAADYLFHSACAQFGSRCLGVVLTGMGRDGADGAYAIKKAGGVVIGESEQSCVIYGMPRAAKESGAISAEYAIEEMAQAIVDRLPNRRTHAA